MDANARRVKAERDRERLPRRSRGARWTLRLLALLATAAFLGSGVAAALRIAPDGKSGDDASDVRALVEPAKTPTPTPKPKPQKPKGPTKAQKAQRAAAVAEIRNQGYTTLKLSDYRYGAKLRVLIGRPVGDAGGGQYAFFFLRDRYLGRDSTSPSTKLSVAKAGKSSVTLAYETAAGRTKVRFKLEGEQLVPLDPIPPAGERLTPTTN